MGLDLRCSGTKGLERLRDHGKGKDDKKYRDEHGDHRQLHRRGAQALEEVGG